MIEERITEEDLLAEGWVKGGLPGTITGPLWANAEEAHWMHPALDPAKWCSFEDARRIEATRRTADDAVSTGIGRRG